MKFFSNKEITKIFRDIAAAYTIKNANHFKIAAYNKAADSIEHATSELKDLWDDDKLDTISGIGKNITNYLNELFTTGRIKHFEQVKKDLPPSMFEFLELSGMGPKNAYKLAKSLKIKSLKGLRLAAKKGKINKIEGFGKKSEADILKSINQYRSKSDRILLPVAFTTANRIIDYLKTNPCCEQIQPLGSLRRMVATVGDIDIGIASKSPQKVINHFKKYHEIERILTAGSRDSSALLRSGIQVDIKVLPPEAYGSLLQHFTGSKNHNIHLREYALKKNMSLSEYGIKIKGSLKKFKDEKSFYKVLNMPYIEPELREDTGEIEVALNNKLPSLVELGDIKGDLHLHSNYPIEPSHDLGENSYQEIIDCAKKLNYEYIGFADHSPSYTKHSKKQILEIIKKRQSKIEQLNSSEKHIRILNLLEVDILANGELSVPIEGLKMLNGAIAGIHSSHNQDKKTITKRLLKAIYSEYIQIIAHPAGRLLQQREAYEVDWLQIFRACSKTKTLLEINAWPTRLDLSDVLIKEALSYGLQLIINS